MKDLPDPFLFNGSLFCAEGKFVFPFTMFLHISFLTQTYCFEYVLCILLIL